MKYQIEFTALGVFEFTVEIESDRENDAEKRFLENWQEYAFNESGRDLGFDEKSEPTIEEISAVERTCSQEYGNEQLEDLIGSGEADFDANAFPDAPRLVELTAAIPVAERESERLEEQRWVCDTLGGFLVSGS